MLDITKVDWDDIPPAFGGFVKLKPDIETIIQFVNDDINSTVGFKGKGISYQFNVIEIDTDESEKVFSTSSLTLINKFKALLPLISRKIGITMHERDGYREYDIRTI